MKRSQPDRRPGAAASPHGFSLFELMIVLVIIGVLGAIAVPSYQGYVDRTRRGEGREALLNTAQVLERCYTTHGSYDDNNCNTGLPRLSEDEFYRIPSDGNNGVSINADSFTLVAAPQGVHSDDECGSLTLAHTGAKGVSGADTGITRDDCW